MHKAKSSEEKSLSTHLTEPWPVCTGENRGNHSPEMVKDPEKTRITSRVRRLKPALLTVS